MLLYTCPCCGYAEFSEPPGSYEICEICFWEDDPVQIADPWFSGGANVPNLVDAQQYFLQYGAMEERFASDVRKPTTSDEKDSSWRMVKPSDKAFVTYPRTSEELALKSGTRVPYYYWLSNNA